MCQIVEFIVQLANYNRCFALFAQHTLNQLLNGADLDLLLYLAMQLLLTSRGREDGAGGDDGAGEIVKSIGKNQFILGF